MSAATTQRIRPAFSGAIDAAAVMGVLCDHVIPGAQIVEPDSRRLHRLLPTSRGPIAVTVRICDDAIELSTDGSDTDELVGMVRSWFDLDTDLAPINALLATDPLLATSVATRPAIRMTRFPDPFEAAITTVLGQQISLAAMRTLSGRLVAAHGRQHDCGLWQFPDPAALAVLDPAQFAREIGMPTTRAAAAISLAQGFISDSRLSAPADTESYREALLAIRGIGPWTTDYLCVRSLGDPDAFAAGDLVARRVMGVETPAQARERAQPWRPYRAYALARIWQHVHET